jgi:hypothetical protein
MTEPAAQTEEPTPSVEDQAAAAAAAEAAAAAKAVLDGARLLVSG